MRHAMLFIISGFCRLLATSDQNRKSHVPLIVASFDWPTFISGFSDRSSVACKNPVFQLAQRLQV